ncbi:MAG: hypothetical protein IT436_13160 [Phycisphaerales bacterium]|nr:hypothetical protein [Phycisphaerales bacterium]
MKDRMGLHHRINRLAKRLAARAAECPLYSGPSLVRIIPAPVVRHIGEYTAADDPSDWCRCGRKVVHRIPPPAVARV